MVIRCPNVRYTTRPRGVTTVPANESTIPSRWRNPTGNGHCHRCQKSGRSRAKRELAEVNETTRGGTHPEMVALAYTTKDVATGVRGNRPARLTDGGHAGRPADRESRRSPTRPFLARLIWHRYRGERDIQASVLGRPGVGYDCLNGLGAESIGRRRNQNDPDRERSVGRSRGRINCNHDHSGRLPAGTVRGVDETVVGPVLRRGPGSDRISPNSLRVLGHFLRRSRSRGHGGQVNVDGVRRVATGNRGVNRERLTLARRGRGD